MGAMVAPMGRSYKSVSQTALLFGPHDTVSSPSLASRARRVIGLELFTGAPLMRIMFFWNQG